MLIPAYIWMVLAAVLLAFTQAGRATTLSEVWQLAKAHAPALEKANATIKRARAVRPYPDLRKPEMTT